MASINKLIYTLASYDPREISNDEEKVVDVHMHNDLLVKLSDNGVIGFNNALLSTTRFMAAYYESDVDDKLEMYNSVVGYFQGSEFNDINDTNNMYLVERICLDNGDVYFNPINVWTVDARIIKAVLVRNMIHSEMNNHDLEITSMHYSLEQYFYAVTIGGVDDSERTEFEKKYYRYLLLFYRRSENPKRNIRLQYYRRYKFKNVAWSYKSRDEPEVMTFQFGLKMDCSIKQTTYDMDQHCDNMKFYAKRLYEVNYYPDWFRAKCGTGKGHYKYKFEIWDRCIRVYDLLKDHINASTTIDDKKLEGKLNHVGKIIVKEFKVFKTYEPSKLRAEIKAYYRDANKLIEQSTQGYISLSDLPPS